VTSVVRVVRQRCGWRRHRILRAPGLPSGSAGGDVGGDLAVAPGVGYAPWEGRMLDASAKRERRGRALAAAGVEVEGAVVEVGGEIYAFGGGVWVAAIAASGCEAFISWRD
jgi:hypothetical protein